MSANSFRVVRVVAAGIAFLGIGCTNRVGDLTIISARQVDLATLQLNPKHGQRVKGSHCVVSIIVPVLPNLGRAVEDALKNGGGDVLVDQVTYLSNYFIGIGTLQCLRVEGTAVSFTRPSS